MRAVARLVGRLRLLLVPITVFLLSCSGHTGQSRNSGVFVGTATGLVLAHPANCLRLTRPNPFAESGQLCLQRSPGPVGRCVEVTFTNGGSMVAGILRLPLKAVTLLPASGCAGTTSS